MPMLQVPTPPSLRTGLIAARHRRVAGCFCSRWRLISPLHPVALYHDRRGRLGARGIRGSPTMAHIFGHVLPPSFSRCNLVRDWQAAAARRKPSHTYAKVDIRGRQGAVQTAIAGSSATDRARPRNHSVPGKPQATKTPLLDGRASLALDAESEAKRPPIPTEGGQRFRSKAATQSERRRPPC